MPSSPLARSVTGGLTSLSWPIVVGSFELALLTVTVPSEPIRTD
jgi:hypothetical protein